MPAMKKMKAMSLIPKSPAMLCLFLCALISACTPIKANHGNLLSDSKIAEVKPGISTRNEVRRNFGAPTAFAPFDSKIWYYVGENTETLGVFKADVKERRIIRVSFNEDGILQEVTDVDPNMTEEINLVDRKTPTAGKEFTAIQQMIGNVGRFQGQKDNKDPAGGNR